MLYSKTAHTSGKSGFYFDDDKNAPPDSIQVADADVQTAINLPSGSTYDFDSTGKLTTTAPTSAYLLAQAQATRIGVLGAAYQNAISQPVSFTTKAGVAKTFQADPGSIANVQASLAGMSGTQTTPTGFYWVAADNTQVLFAYADLQGLAAAMLAQGWAAFQNLQTKKAAVNAATTVTAVQAVVW